MASATEQPKKFFLEHFTGNKEERVRAILLNIKTLSYTGPVEIHTDYQTIRFQVRNGQLAKSKSICSVADILDSIE